MKKVFLTIAAIASLSVGFGQSQTEPCPGVTANFESEADLASGGINFTNVTVSTEKSNYTYFWDFGNGQKSTKKDPFMMFEEGNYVVKLSVKSSGCETVVEKNIEFSYNGK